MKDDKQKWLRGPRGEALSSAMRASKAGGPTEAQRKRLEAALGIGAGAGGPAPSSLPKPHFPGYWLAVPALIGAGAVAAWKLGAGHSDVPPRVVEPTPIVSASAPEPGPTPVFVPPAVTTPPSATTTVAAPVASTKKPVSSTTADPDAELAIVKLAEDLLESDPSAALAKASERERRFPNGLFGEEGEVVAIDALARLGRSRDAHARADTFLAAHPSSAYRTRIVRALARLGTHDE